MFSSLYLEAHIEEAGIYMLLVKIIVDLLLFGVQISEINC
jgi:hypothetical protein